MELPITTHDLSYLVTTALQAGQAIMKIYHGEIVVAQKPDHSPVTEADVAAEKIILAGLQRNFPNIPVISEEQHAEGVKLKVAETFFLVDPLDGTKEFISRNGEFTVNIALIHNGQPVMGVVFAPATNEIFAGHQGSGAKKADVATLEFAAIKARPCPMAGPTILASRSHLDAETKAFIEAQKPAELSNAGSSLKFCRLAEGAADLYPRFGRTMEWDTAAGHAILLAAGGSMTKPDGSPFIYGKPGFENGPFIAKGA